MKIIFCILALMITSTAFADDVPPPDKIKTFLVDGFCAALRDQTESAAYRAAFAAELQRRFAAGEDVSSVAANEQEVNAIAEQQPAFIGESEKAVICVLGEPLHENDSSIGEHSSAQLIYGTEDDPTHRQYIYIEDGVVTSIQDEG